MPKQKTKQESNPEKSHLSQASKNKGRYLYNLKVVVEGCWENGIETYEDHEGYEESRMQYIIDENTKEEFYIKNSYSFNIRDARMLAYHLAEFACKSPNKRPGHNEVCGLGVKERVLYNKPVQCRILPPLEEA